MGYKSTVSVDLVIKIHSRDIDSVSDIVEYISDRFGNSVVKWM